MINYIEKGYALHNAIRAAGQWIREENGVWISSNDEIVQNIIDNFDAISEAIVNKKAEIDAFARRLRDKAISAYSPGEIGKWQAKYDQARAYIQSKNVEDAPDLAMEAQYGNTTLDAVATRVIANGNMFSNLEAKIAGACGRHKRIVESMQNLDEIINYDFSAWWN